jgi:1,4-alpha-glucan branching enzyme
MPGDDWQKFANLRAYLAFMWAHPGKKLLFMGCEFGQPIEWNHDAELQWQLLEQDSHRGIQGTVRALNDLVKSQPALYERDFSSDGFEWVVGDDRDQSVFAFLRHGEAPHPPVLVVCNFTPMPRSAYRIGVSAGKWREILNSDAAGFGGSDIGNAGLLLTENIPAHGREHSLVLTLPPLATIFLRPEP